MRRASALALATLLVQPGVLRAAPTEIALRDSVKVSPAGPVRSIRAAVTLVRPGGRVVVQPGVYAESTIVIDRPLELRGVGGPTLDGRAAHTILVIAADDVTIAGLRFAHVASSMVEDRAALRVEGRSRCVIADNRFDDTFFAIYLARARDCRIERNVIRGRSTDESISGNGIHLWTSRGVLIRQNSISGHRDGIYFEFVHDSRVADNVSEGNLRYGLHFMYSDDCRYTGNTFAHNGSGVAVMYTRGVEMRGNHFVSNWGAAAYGLLLKEISDVTLEGNEFRGNTTALMADGVTRLEARANTFTANGWALRLEANTTDSRVVENDFRANTFDVTSNGRGGSTAFARNYWDEYDGYDLGRDGIGDVPHHPVRLYSVLAQRTETSLILLRSGLVQLLDAAERLVPSITPESVVDSTPAIRPHVGARRVARAPEGR